VQDTAGPAPTIRILVVDDEEEIRAALKRLLARLPYPGLTVDEAASGEDAITLLRRNAYRLILSDYRMGRVTGVDVLEIARLEQPHAARVLMTGYEDMEIAREAVNRARIEGLLRKPWDNDKLRGVLDTLLGDPQAAARAPAASPAARP
jgi:YesN/AraC family two-component response regulator